MESNQKLFYHFIHVLSFIAILSKTFLAQAPDILWTKTYGQGRANFVIETNDSGFIMVGNRGPYLGHNYYRYWWNHYYWNAFLIKTDEFGDTLWTKSYEDSNHSYQGNSIQQTNDNGYIVVGADSIYVWLLKTDEFGNTIWAKSIDGGPVGIHWGNSIFETEYGGYIIGGIRNYLKTFTDDITYVFGNDWLNKTDTQGDTLWTKTYRNNPSGSNCVQMVNDGGFIIVSTRVTDKNYEEVWLLRTDEFGDTLWTKAYGGSHDDYGNYVQQTHDGGFIIVGTKDINYCGNIWLIKTDEFGDTLWTKTYGEGIGNFVIETNDNGIIIVGINILIKTDEYGDTLWTKTFEEEGIANIQQTSDCGYIATGGANDNIYLIKLAPEVTSINENQSKILTNFQLRQNHPNPFNPTTNIEFSIPISEFVTLKIYNVLGEEVTTLVSEKLTAGKYKYKWDVGGLASGMYFYKLEAGNFVQTKKMLLIR